MSVPLYARSYLSCGDCLRKHAGLVASSAPSLGCGIGRFHQLHAFVLTTSCDFDWHSVCFRLSVGLMSCACYQVPIHLAYHS